MGSVSGDDVAVVVHQQLAGGRVHGVVAVVSAVVVEVLVLVVVDVA